MFYLLNLSLTVLLHTRGNLDLGRRPKGAAIVVAHGYPEGVNRMLGQRVCALLIAAPAVILLGVLGWQAPAQAAQDEKGNRGDASGNVTLRITGDKGTQFSGTCSVGEEEHEISGQVPQTLTYDPDGQKLECKIRKQSDESGELEVALSSEDARSVQRVKGEDVVLRLTYADGTISSSTTSSSSQLDSSSSSRQTVTSSGDSSSSAGDSNERGGDDAQSRAERIIDRVFRAVGLEN